MVLWRAALAISQERERATRGFAEALATIAVEQAKMSGVEQPCDETTRYYCCVQRARALLMTS